MISTLSTRTLSVSGLVSISCSDFSLKFDSSTGFDSISESISESVSKFSVIDSTFPEDSLSSSLLRVLFKLLSFPTKSFLIKSIIFNNSFFNSLLI